MISTPLLVKDRFESPVNRALTHVAQTVVKALQHAYPIQVDASNHVWTISIRASDPEYKQLIAIKPLTARELEVLQLIVEGDKNSTIFTLPKVR